MAFHLDRAVVLLDNVERRRQAEVDADPDTVGHKARIKNTGDVFAWNSLPRVGNTQLNLAVPALVSIVTTPSDSML